MCRYTVIAVVMVVALLSAGCVLPGMNLTFLAGSGATETRTFDFADFTEVEAQSAFRVVVTQGDEFAVSVTADDNLWDILDVRQVGERVIFGLGQFGTIRNATMEAEVTMPVLEEFSLSGAANGRFSGFASTEPFVAEISGASRMEGDIGAAAVRMSLSGASRATVVGAGDTLTLDVSGASNADLEEFGVNDADVVLSGSSRATVNAAGMLSVDASGASRLIYLGSPQLGPMETSGSSVIEQR